MNTKQITASKAKKVGLNPTYNNTDSNTNSMPRRYEESKPVMTQAYTHRSILSIGQSIHTKWEHDALSEREAAIRATEDSVWAEGERIKNTEIHKVMIRCNHEKEKALQDLQDKHEQMLKEQTVRIENEMQKVTIETVQAEREEAKVNLQNTIEKLKTQCEKKRIKSVEIARMEEKDLAAKEAAITALNVEKEKERLCEQLTQDKETALKNLEIRSTKEKETGICKAQSIQRKKAAMEIQNLKQLHSNEISSLEDKIREENEAHKLTKYNLEQTIKEKDNLLKEYETLKESYQMFINETKGFRPGQADFLLQ